MNSLPDRVSFDVLALVHEVPRAFRQEDHGHQVGGGEKQE